MSCSNTVEIGAYILGALTPADRSRIGAHLIDCRVCQQELVSLAPVPGLLSLVMPAEIPHSAAASGGGKIPLPVAESTAWPAGRRHTRRWLIAAVLAIVVAGGTIAGLGVPGSSGGSGAQQTVVLRGTDPTSGLQATARLTPQSWGTKVVLQLGDLPPNAWCQLVVHAGGRAEVGASWAAPPHSNTTDLPAATSFTIADITSLDVVATGGRQLIDLPKKS